MAKNISVLTFVLLIVYIEVGFFCALNYVEWCQYCMLVV